jgi:putative glutamine amidotransferase
MNSNRAPILIGMPTQLDPGTDSQYLSRRYTESIAASGGVPILIPLLETSEVTDTIIDQLSGILLSGNNSDLDPALYGEIRLETCGPTQPLRDRMDFYLLEAAFKRKLPVLAICFGIQSLNVFLGGSLVQDIPSCLATPIQHNNGDSNECPSHEIEISAGSILEQIAGGLKKTVNSTHHQAVKHPGQGLEVIARAPDNVVESVSYSDPNHWVLGIQWHPEKSFACDEFSRKIFEFFLARCRAARGIDEGTDTQNA